MYTLMLGNCTTVSPLLLKFIGKTRKYEQSIYAMIKSGTTTSVSQSTKRNTILEYTLYSSQSFGKPEILCVRVHVQKPRPTLAKEAIDEDLGIMRARVCVRACAKSDSPVDKANGMGLDETTTSETTGRRFVPLNFFPQKFLLESSIRFSFSRYVTITRLSK